MIEGQLAYVIGHHKFHPQSERAKVNTRYLPGRVGQLLAIYLAYVQREGSGPYRGEGEGDNS